jgi:hypothetical protein
MCIALHKFMLIIGLRSLNFTIGGGKMRASTHSADGWYRDNSRTRQPADNIVLNTKEQKMVDEMDNRWNYFLQIIFNDVFA